MLRPKLVLLLTDILQSCLSVSISASTSASYYLSMRPSNAQIWHKAVFKVGPVAGLKPTRVRQGQKYPQPSTGRICSQVSRHTRQNHLEVKRPTEYDPTTGEERPHKHP